MTGMSYSSFLTGKKKERNFSVINWLGPAQRYIAQPDKCKDDEMLTNGLLGEIKGLYPYGI